MAKRRSSAKLDPSQLPGTYRTRVFVGGSYRVAPVPLAETTHGRSQTMAPRGLLDLLRDVVKESALHPVVAAEFQVEDMDRDIHHDALYLLHACRLAVFELSEFSGALMEIERAADYGTLCLVLYDDPRGDGWRLSRMLSSFVQEHPDRFWLHGYDGVDTAKNAARNWLREMKRRRHV
jgi:hypothetical protein